MAEPRLHRPSIVKDVLSSPAFAPADASLDAHDAALSQVSTKASSLDIGDDKREGDMVLATGQQLLLELTESAEPADALLALPPPPSYDVVVSGLSISVPRPRKTLSIPLPRFVKDAAHKQAEKVAELADESEVSDGFIIRNVNAVVRHGELLAIIGGSGSGKTTLLHAIAARLGNLPISEGSVSFIPSSGEVANNVYHKGGGGHFKGMSKVIGFVRQNDYLLPHLTGTLY